MVSEGVEVCGLDEAAVVVHVAFDEVRDVGPVLIGQSAGGQGGEGGEGWVDGVEHVVFQGMGGEVGLLLEEFGNVAAGFGGRTEEGGAGGPSHLECRGDHDHDVIVRVGWVRGEDMAELVLVGFGHHHAPEAVLDVEFSEEDGAVGIWEGGDHVDEAAEDIAELVHGVGGGVGALASFVSSLTDLVLDLC